MKCLALLFPLLLAGCQLLPGPAHLSFHRLVRQGLRREHVGSVVLFCALADAVLISAGVLGMAQALGERPGVARALALAGAAFLAWYGWQALQRARHAHQLQANRDGARLGRGAVLAQAAAFTLLNPHVYLDTVLLIGSLGAQQPVPGAYALGAASASLMWFFCLALGAAWLAPWLARPSTWRFIDLGVALMMFSIAWQLLNNPGML